MKHSFVVISIMKIMFVLVCTFCLQSVQIFLTKLDLHCIITHGKPACPWGDTIACIACMPHPCTFSSGWGTVSIIPTLSAGLSHPAGQILLVCGLLGDSGNVNGFKGVLVWVIDRNITELSALN
jgi:hypothetical protein